MTMEFFKEINPEVGMHFIMSQFGLHLELMSVKVCEID